MSQAKERVGIHCPIGLFPRKQEEIIRLTEKIRQGRTLAEKAPWAQSLIESANMLMGCDHYDEESACCRLCQTFSELRREVADLVIEARKLELSALRGERSTA